MSHILPWVGLFVLIVVVLTAAWVKKEGQKTREYLDAMRVGGLSQVP